MFFAAFDFSTIVEWLKSPLGTILATVLVGWLAKSNPTLGAILHRILDAVGLKFADPRAAKNAGPAELIEEPWETVKYAMADRAIDAWASGDADQAKKVLDAIVLISPRGDGVQHAARTKA